MRVSSAASSAFAVFVGMRNLRNRLALLNDFAAVLAHLIAGVAFFCAGSVFGVFDFGFTVALCRNHSCFQCSFRRAGFVAEILAAAFTVPVGNVTFSVQEAAFASVFAGR